MPQNASMEELGFIKVDQARGKETELWWHPTDPFFTCERCKTLDDGTGEQCLWQRLYLMMGETELYRKKKCWRCVKAGVPCSCAISTIDFNLVLRAGRPVFLRGWDGQEVSHAQVVAAYNERVGQRPNEEGGRSPREVDQRLLAGPSEESNDQACFNQPHSTHAPDVRFAIRPSVPRTLSPYALARPLIHPMPPFTHPGPRPPLLPRPAILPIAHRPAVPTLPSPQTSAQVRPPVFAPTADLPGSSISVPSAVHTAPISASQRTSSVHAASHGEAAPSTQPAEPKARTHEPDWWYHRVSFIREAQEVGGVPLINTFLSATGGNAGGNGTLPLSDHLKNIKRLLSQAGRQLDLVIDLKRDDDTVSYTEVDLERAVRLRTHLAQMEMDIMAVGPERTQLAAVDDAASHITSGGAPTNIEVTENAWPSLGPKRENPADQVLWRRELEESIGALRQEVRVLQARGAGSDGGSQQDCEIIAAHIEHASLTDMQNMRRS